MLGAHIEVPVSLETAERNLGVFYCNYNGVLKKNVGNYSGSYSRFLGDPHIGQPMSAKSLGPRPSSKP